MDCVEDEAEISTQDGNKCVAEMVKAILILDHSKKPFKQADISGFLSNKPSRKEWNTLLKKAKKNLNDMGLKLMESKHTSTNSYFLISNIFPLPIMHEFAPEEEVADRTLLILILTFIFMKEGTVTSVDLFNHLHQLHIYNENNPVHEYFGDVKKKITIDFVSQLYLEKVVDKESEVFGLKWGERAHAEVTKKSILDFVCEIGYEGSIQPKHLVSHYQKVLKEERRGINVDSEDDDDEVEEENSPETQSTQKSKKKRR